MLYIWSLISVVLLFRTKYSDKNKFISTMMKIPIPMYFDIYGDNSSNNKLNIFQLFSTFILAKCKYKPCFYSSKTLKTQKFQFSSNKRTNSNQRSMIICECNRFQKCCFFFFKKISSEMFIFILRKRSSPQIHNHGTISLCKLLSQDEETDNLVLYQDNTPQPCLFGLNLPSNN